MTKKRDQTKGKVPRQHKQMTLGIDNDPRPVTNRLAPPVHSTAKKGDYIGAKRAPWPSFWNKKHNIRPQIFPLTLDRTGILDNKYDAKVVAPKKVDKFFPPASKCSLGQQGCPQLLRGIKQLQPGGAHHWLYSKTR